MIMSHTSCADSPYLAVIDDSTAGCQQVDFDDAPPSYLENTIGGPLRIPRRLASGFDPELTMCGQCGGPMLSLMQLSCPLIGLDCRRLLYFFVCQNTACLEGPAVPMLCLRAQFACSGGHVLGAVSTVIGGAARSYSEWGEGADDWGDGDAEQAVWAQTEALSEEIETITEPANAEAAVGTSHEETLVIQTIASIQTCRQLAVFDEVELLSLASVDQKLSSLVSSAEEQLRSGESGLSSGGGDESGSAMGQDGAADADDERDQALTKLEQKFYERLSLCPGQLLRYQWSGRPLLVAPLPLPPAPVCQLCGCERTFELQLMPGLLDALRGVSSISERLDMATALVFTCSASCQPTGTNSSAFVKEVVLAQRELPFSRGPHLPARALVQTENRSPP